MGFHAGRSTAIAPLVQALGVLVAFATFAFWPPAEGRMLLIPVAGDSDYRLAASVIDHGGRLLGAGPVPGSLIVIGSRARIAQGLLRRGILTIAAPATACGDRVRSA